MSITSLQLFVHRIVNLWHYYQTTLSKISTEIFLVSTITVDLSLKYLKIYIANSETYFNFSELCIGLVYIVFNIDKIF